MVDSSNYTLLLGVSLNLPKRVIETNPDWKGIKDKEHPNFILSPLSEDEYSNMCDRGIHDERYAYGERWITMGHIFPDNTIVENLVEEEVFTSEYEYNPHKLCFIADSYRLEDRQLLGITVLHHSTREVYKQVDEQQILTPLGQKGKIAERINHYGFQFKPEDIILHQYIMREG